MSSPISGFTAIPNPQMLAFMGAQSFIMMYQAGEGWQYGKRKISAMSNEEFNKLTPNIVLEKQAVVLKDALGTIETSMNNMTPMVRTIVEQYGDFVREIIKASPQVVRNLLDIDPDRDKDHQTIAEAIDQTFKDIKLEGPPDLFQKAFGETSTSITTTSGTGSSTITKGKTGKQFKVVLQDTIGGGKLKNQRTSGDRQVVLFLKLGSGGISQMIKVNKKYLLKLKIKYEQQRAFHVGLKKRILRPRPGISRGQDLSNILREAEATQALIRNVVKLLQNMAFAKMIISKREQGIKMSKWYHV